MAFRNKVNQILSYNPDLLIIPECESPDKHNDQFYHQAFWIGENKNKGLGVFSFNNIDIEIHESYNENYRYVLPIRVKNPEISSNSIIIAIWSQNNRQDVMRRYIGEVWNSLNYYKDLLNSDTIIDGDFNWNIIWDKKPHEPLYGNFMDVVNLLSQYDIHSVYHTYKNIEFGNEIEPTLYFRKNKNAPYHIDYIFASSEAISKVNKVSIGRHENWISYSDHMPLMVNFA